jgi:hypothetical protein
MNIGLLVFLIMTQQIFLVTSIKRRNINVVQATSINLFTIVLIFFIIQEDYLSSFTRMLGFEIPSNFIIVFCLGFLLIFIINLRIEFRNMNRKIQLLTMKIALDEINDNENV